MLVSHDYLKKEHHLEFPYTWPGAVTSTSLWEIKRSDLTLPCVSLISDFIKLPDYINGLRIESQAQGKLEQYFVFLPRIFSALRKLDETDPTQLFYTVL